MFLFCFCGVEICNCFCDMTYYDEGNITINWVCAICNILCDLFDSTVVQCFCFVFVV